MSLTPFFPHLTEILVGLGLIGLEPLLILTIIITLLLLLVAFNHQNSNNHFLTLLLTSVGFLGAFLFIPPNSETLIPLESSLFIIDKFGQFLMGPILLGALVIGFYFYAHFNNHKEEFSETRPEEFYMLLLISVFGAILMVISRHMFIFFLGLETLTIPLYAMVAYFRHREESLEAGIKYIVLASLSTAIFLFGLALIYAQLGTLDLPLMGQSLKNYMNQFSSTPSLVISGGLTLMLVGIGFKLSLFPFHMWAPDVYEGSSLPVTAYLATISKGAVLIATMRVFSYLDLFSNTTLMTILTSIIIITMTVGNLLALKQTNIKRLLAYSSMAHMGYILVGFLCGNQEGFSADVFYLVAYFVTLLTAFGVLISLSSKEKSYLNLNDFKGLFYKCPLKAFAFSVALLSLIGMPLTVGFVGKFSIVMAAIHLERYPLALIMVLNSALGLYYYLKFITCMFSDSSHHESVGIDSENLQNKTAKKFCCSIPSVKNLHFKTCVLLNATVVGLSLVIVYLGIQPSRLIEIIEKTTTVFIK